MRRSPRTAPARTDRGDGARSARRRAAVRAGGPNWLVESFIETVPLTGGGERCGGTLAPTLRRHVDGASTYLVEQLEYGFIPAMADVGGARTPGVEPAGAGCRSVGRQPAPCRRTEVMSDRRNVVHDAGAISPLPRSISGVGSTTWRDGPA
jgi:hypothetical protein